MKRILSLVGIATLLLVQPSVRADEGQHADQKVQAELSDFSKCGERTTEYSPAELRVIQNRLNDFKYKNELLSAAKIYDSAEKGSLPKEAEALVKCFDAHPEVLRALLVSYLEAEKKQSSILMTALKEAGAGNGQDALLQKRLAQIRDLARQGKHVEANKLASTLVHSIAKIKRPTFLEVLQKAMKGSKEENDPAYFHILTAIQVERRLAEGKDPKDTDIHPELLKAGLDSDQARVGMEAAFAKAKLFHSLVEKYAKASKEERAKILEELKKNGWSMDPQWFATHFKLESEGSDPESAGRLERIRNGATAALNDREIEPGVWAVQTQGRPDVSVGAVGAGPNGIDVVDSGTLDNYLRMMGDPKASGHGDPRRRFVKLDPTSAKVAQAVREARNLDGSFDKDKIAKILKDSGNPDLVHGTRVARASGNDVVWDHFKRSEAVAQQDSHQDTQVQPVPPTPPHHEQPAIPPQDHAEQVNQTRPEQNVAQNFNIHDPCTKKILEKMGMGALLGPNPKPVEFNGRVYLPPLANGDIPVVESKEWEALAEKVRGSEKHKAVLAKNKIEIGDNEFKFKDNYLPLSSISGDGADQKELREFFDKVVQEGFSKALLNPDRTEAVVVGNQVFLPEENGKIPVMSKEAWDHSIQSTIEIFNREEQGLKNYLERRNGWGSAVTNYREWMSGKLWDVMGWDQSVNGKNKFDIEVEGYYKPMLQMTNRLRTLGANPKLVKDFTGYMAEINKKEADVLKLVQQHLIAVPSYAVIMALYSLKNPKIAFQMMAGLAVGAIADTGKQLIEIYIDGTRKEFDLDQLYDTSVTAMLIAPVVKVPVLGKLVVAYGTFQAARAAACDAVDGHWGSAAYDAAFAYLGYRYLKGKPATGTATATAAETPTVPPTVPPTAAAAEAATSATQPTVPVAQAQLPVPVARPALTGPAQQTPRLLTAPEQPRLLTGPTEPRLVTGPTQPKLLNGTITQNPNPQNALIRVPQNNALARVPTQKPGLPSVRKPTQGELIRQDSNIIDLSPEDWRVISSEPLLETGGGRARIGGTVPARITGPGPARIAGPQPAKLTGPEPVRVQEPVAQEPAAGSPETPPTKVKNPLSLNLDEPTGKTVKPGLKRDMQGIAPTTTREKKD